MSRTTTISNEAFNKFATSLNYTLEHYLAITNHQTICLSFFSAPLEKHPLKDDERKIVENLKKSIKDIENNVYIDMPNREGPRAGGNKTNMQKTMELFELVLSFKSTAVSLGGRVLSIKHIIYLNFSSFPGTKAFFI